MGNLIPNSVFGDNSGGAGGGGSVDSVTAGDTSITVGGTASDPTVIVATAGVTLAKMANLAQDQFIGRTTASTGVPETATITAAARSVLDDTTVAAMVDTLGGASSTGSGGLVRATSPALVTPNIGTPSAGTLTNCTGLPIAGTTGYGTGVATALAVNVGSAGAFVTFNGALGTPSSGTLTNCTGGSADKAAVPLSSKSAAYTTVLGDANTTILHPSTDNNARTFTIDSNANVAYPVGTMITFINRVNTVTIAITSDTLYLAGAGTTGSRTLAAYGVAVATKTGTTEWVISGTGLT